MHLFGGKCHVLCEGVGRIRLQGTKSRIPWKFLFMIVLRDVWTLTRRVISPVLSLVSVLMDNAPDGWGGGEIASEGGPLGLGNPTFPFFSF